MCQEQQLSVHGSRRRGVVESSIAIEVDQAKEAADGRKCNSMD